MDELLQRTLRLTTPCCRRRVRLPAVVGVPREIREHTCRKCGQRWQVTRTTVQSVRQPDGQLTMIDRIDWMLDPKEV